jgi:uncharacterized peroxidase-related enzyme
VPNTWPEARAVPLLRSLPEGATLADLRRTYATLFERLRPYAERLMRSPSPLSPAEREPIAAYVSGVNACRYCYGAHSLVAKGFGIDEAVFETLVDDVERAPVPERLKPILRYARKLTESPSRITQADADAIYAAGWSDEAFAHAVAVIAYFNNMNRLVDGTGIVGTAEDYAQAAGRLIESGYTDAGEPR